MRLSLAPFVALSAVAAHSASAAIITNDTYTEAAPLVIQAETYDATGGAGVHSSGNFVNSFDKNDWINFEVTVEDAGEYLVWALTGTTYPNLAFGVLEDSALDGTFVSLGQGAVTDNENYQAFVETQKVQVTLPAGSYTLRYQNVSGASNSFNTDEIRIAFVPEPASVALVGVGLALVASRRRG